MEEQIVFCMHHVIQGCIFVHWSMKCRGERMALSGG
jgi:hypothetical protein